MLHRYPVAEAQEAASDEIQRIHRTVGHRDGLDGTGPARVQRIGERWRRAGFDLNPADLFYQGERSIVIDYLTGHSWQVTAYPAPELYQRNGFTFPEDESMALFRDMSYVSATLK